MTKPIILIFVGCYLPGYKSGGHVRTIANMVDQLGDAFDFRIVAGDRDSFETKPYPEVQVDAWNTVGKAQVYYVARNNLTFSTIRCLIQKTPHDILYLNSFFAVPYTLKPLVLRRMRFLTPRPVVLAPRGEFSKGALALKNYKKKIYIRIVNFLGLYRSLIWQASSEYEKADIKRTMLGVAHQIHIAPDLGASPPQTKEKVAPFLPNGDRPLKVVFLSRISPMKNLDLALQVFQQVTIPVNFNIYGAVSDKNYWKQCQILISKLPDRIAVQYHGVIEHNAVLKVIAEHDLFFLPTRGENYGHAILEALSAGVPPLISDQTLWQDLDQAGVGWVRSLDDKSAFKEVIEQLAFTDVTERNAQRERAWRYALNVAQSKTIREQNMQLFKSAIKNAIKKRGSKT